LLRNHYFVVVLLSGSDEVQRPLINANKEVETLRGHNFEIGSYFAEEIDTDDICLHDTLRSGNRG